MKIIKLTKLDIGCDRPLIKIKYKSCFKIKERIAVKSTTRFFRWADSDEIIYPYFTILEYFIISELNELYL